MALILTTAIVSDIRGRLNGSFFQQKKGSISVNNVNGKLTKADAGRQALQASQLRFGAVAGLWRTLSNEMMAAWSAAAVNFPKVNKLGRPYTPSGYELFCEFQNNWLALGNDAIVSAPTPTTVYDASGINCTWSSGSLSYYNSTPALTDEALILVFASAPVSRGRNHSKGLLKIIDKRPANNDGPEDITAAYTAVFGVAPTNGSTFFNFVPIQRSNAQRGSGKLTKADAG